MSLLIGALNLHGDTRIICHHSLACFPEWYILLPTSEFRPELKLYSHGLFTTMEEPPLPGGTAESFFGSSCCRRKGDAPSCSLPGQVKNKKCYRVKQSYDL